MSQFPPSIVWILGVKLRLLASKLPSILNHPTVRGGLLPYPQTHSLEMSIVRVAESGRSSFFGTENELFTVPTLLSNISYRDVCNVYSPR